jgi:hypothetical protein
MKKPTEPGIPSPPALTRRQFFVRSVTGLGAAALGFSAVPPRASAAGMPATIETTLVDPEAISFGTFHSNNQKVVRNARGIFITHIRTRNQTYTAQHWRLSWSRDGGKIFSTLDEGTAATNPLTLETDTAGNLYAGRPDFAERRLHLHRYLTTEDFRPAHITSVPHGFGGKWAMALDEKHGQVCYFSLNNDLVRFRLDGSLIDSRRLTAPGPNAVLQYPHLALGGDGVLHAAWTSLQVKKHRYWAIHHAQSPDGGVTWTNFAGQPLPVPIVVDETGPSDRITLDDEFEPSTWLANMLIKDGKAHFLYSAQPAPLRQHHVRYDLATGARDFDHVGAALKGAQLAIRALDGFFCADARKPGAPLYCVSREVKAKHLVCLRSDDQGATWRDHAIAGPFNSPYGIGGCREVTPDGFVIGTFTELEGSEVSKFRGGRVWFFKIKT